MITFIGTTDFLACSTLYVGDTQKWLWKQFQIYWQLSTAILKLNTSVFGSIL